MESFKCTKTDDIMCRQNWIFENCDMLLDKFDL